MANLLPNPFEINTTIKDHQTIHPKTAIFVSCYHDISIKKSFITHEKSVAQYLITKKKQHKKQRNMKKGKNVTKQTRKTNESTCTKHYYQIKSNQIKCCPYTLEKSNANLFYNN